MVKSNFVFPLIIYKRKIIVIIITHFINKFITLEFIHKEVFVYQQKKGHDLLCSKKVEKLL